MYTLQQFSYITKLTIKSLCELREEGILIPMNNEYYTEEDFLKACKLHLLLAFAIPHNDLLEIVKNYTQDDELCKYLRESVQQAGKNILEEINYMRAMEEYLSLSQSRTYMQAAYQIKEETIPTRRIAKLNFVGNHSHIKEQTERLLKVVKGKEQGKVFALFYDFQYQEEMHIAICIEVKQGATIQDEQLELVEIPETKGLSLFHIGNYDVLSIAYKALFDDAIKQGKTPIFPLMERYHKGQGKLFKGNPKKFITEVFIPIK